MKKFTIDEFRKQYPNDDACLHKLYQIRCSNLVCKCGNDQSERPFTRVKNRRSYQCPICGFQVYPTQGTVFEKTTTPLNFWFFAIYLQTTTRNGVAAKELQRQMKICYTTALRMAHQIKRLMANNKEIIDKLTGIVSIDESYFGMKAKNMHRAKRAEMHANNVDHNINKTGVMGFVSQANDEKKIKFEVMTDLSTFKQRVRRNVANTAIVVTDSHSAYKGLDVEFLKHEIVNHIADEYKNKDGFHTNNVEAAWSQLKRTIKGTHIHVSVKYLQLYVDEVAFRLMNKDKQDRMFDIILSHVA